MLRTEPIRYAESDGLEIAYQVVGDGPVDLLYVPGAANHIEAMWDLSEMSRFTERLASFSRLILMDKRGTGLSDRMPADARATPEERVDDVRAVLDAVGSKSSYLFATADGTPIAILAAASHPHRVQGLALYAASARLMADDDYPIGFPPEAFDVFIEGFATTWASEDDDTSLRFSAPSLVHDPRWRAGMARIQRRGSTPREASRYWSVNMRIDVREVLPAVRVPTLVLHCSGDRLYPVAHGRYVADHIPDARFIELDGTDHFFFAENSERVAQELEEFVTGRRSQHSDDRSLATVLFTDIVGSTERGAAIGDRRWRSLLDAHDEITRLQVERYDGRVVKTTGDGCLAVFDGPRRAILAADAARAATAALDLPIRAGLHTGEIEIRGDDVAGMAVNLAARVAGEAGPGEIFVTRTVRDLVVGSTLQFAERGERTLSGFREAWLLYELVST